MHCAKRERERDGERRGRRIVVDGMELRDELDSGEGIVVCRNFHLCRHLRRRRSRSRFDFRWDASTPTSTIFFVLPFLAFKLWSDLINCCQHNSMEEAKGFDQQYHNSHSSMVFV